MLDSRCSIFSLPLLLWGFTAIFIIRRIRDLCSVRCCELGRSLLNDRQMSLHGGVCSLGGYEPAYRACACVCGKGILRRDLRYTSPGQTHVLIVQLRRVMSTRKKL